MSAPARLAALLSSQPDLAREVSTGGATPLHMAGMSRAAQVMHGTCYDK